MLTVKQKIQAMGGTVEVAKMLRISPAAVSQWTDIPLGHVPEIERLSKGEFDRFWLRPDYFWRFGAPT